MLDMCISMYKCRNTYRLFLYIHIYVYTHTQIHIRIEGEEERKIDRPGLFGLNALLGGCFRVVGPIISILPVILSTPSPLVMNTPCIRESIHWGFVCLG